MATMKFYAFQKTRVGRIVGEVGKAKVYPVIAYVIPSTDEMKLYRLNNDKGDSLSASQLTSSQLASMTLTDDRGAKHWAYQLGLSITQAKRDIVSLNREEQRLVEMIDRTPVIGVEYPYHDEYHSDPERADEYRNDTIRREVCTDEAQWGWIIWKDYEFKKTFYRDRQRVVTDEWDSTKGRSYNRGINYRSAEYLTKKLAGTQRLLKKLMAALAAADRRAS